MSDRGPRGTTDAIPHAYRLVLTRLEPLIVLGGVAQTLLAPSTYAAALTRNTLAYDPATRFLYTQLAGAWVLLCFLEVFVLGGRRYGNDPGMWKMLCWGMLLQDVLYGWSVAEAVGGWGRWCRVWEWDAWDWVVFVTTTPQIVVRALVVLGVGMGKGGVKGE